MKRAVIGAALVFALGVTVWFAGLDHCPPIRASTSDVSFSFATTLHALHVGGASVEIHPPYPLPIAGYPPIRPTVRAASSELFARAVVLRAGGRSFAWVVLDVVQVPSELVETIRQQLGAQVQALWVSASHTHSSFGAYDARPIAQLAATGRFRSDARDTLVRAAVDSVQRAIETTAPARIQTATETLPDAVTVARSGGALERRVDRVVFEAADGRAIASIVVLAAHPTLIPRKGEVLDADYPGALARQLQAPGETVLVVQGAVGNAGAGEREVGRFAETLAARIKTMSGVALPADARFSFTRAPLSLPQLDTSRLTPRPFTRALANAFCWNTTFDAELSALTLGPLRWVAVPFEPTGDAVAALQLGDARVIGLVDGYFGYLESPERVRAREGEAKRQYFSDELLEHVGRASRVVLR